MKIKIIVILFIALIFIVVGCHKTNSPDYNVGLFKSILVTEPPNVTPSSYLYSFTYDKSGSTTVNQSDYFPYKASFTIAGASNLAYDLNEIPIFPYTSIGEPSPLWFGPNYSVASSLIYSIDNTGRVTHSNQGVLLKYDTAGYLIQWQYLSDSSNVAINVISNGNIIQSIIPLNITGLNNYDTITYTFLSSIDNRNSSDHISSILGMGNKNLVNTCSHSFSGYPYCQHFYSFDAMQRVIMDSMVWNGSMARTYSYTYY